jgi:tRNA (guanine37-N1)-methyltransferase
MKIDILTLFPEMFAGPFDTSMLKRAKDKKLVEINIHNLRDWAVDKHKTVDDRPFGGGLGMVIRVDVVYRALKELKTQNSKLKTSSKNLKIILLSPQGNVFTQEKARKLVKNKHLILIAGHYEGFDERIRQHLVDEEISIGDYILTGGEIPAMVLVDSTVRLLPGVLEKEAINNESFSKVKSSTLPASRKMAKVSLLDFPQYTKPVNYMGWGVPEVLLSGNHGEINKWRQKKAFKKTEELRPDLL